MTETIVEIKANILKREARILRGHFGPTWKEVLTSKAAAKNVEIQVARREALLDIIEPLLGYSIKEVAVDQEDVDSMRRV